VHLTGLMIGVSVGCSSFFDAMTKLDYLNKKQNIKNTNLTLPNMACSIEGI
jgi:hypothetical protein